MSSGDPAKFGSLHSAMSAGGGQSALRRVAGMRTTSSRHHTWRPDFFFVVVSMPQLICLGKVRFSGTKLLGYKTQNEQ